MKKITTITTAFLIVLMFTSQISQAVYVPCFSEDGRSAVSYDQVCKGIDVTGLTQVTIHKGKLIPHINLAATNVYANKINSCCKMMVYELPAVDIIATKECSNVYATVEKDGERIPEVTLSAIEIIPLEDNTEWTAFEPTNSNPITKLLEGFHVEIPKINFNVVRRILFL